MPLSLSPTQDDVLTALRTVLLAALPAGRQVVQGQANRVPEVAADCFAVVTPLRRERLETNTDEYQDCRLIGSIADAVLTATAVQFADGTPGSIVLGSTLYGAGVTAGTVIQSQISGPTSGGVGTYQLSAASTVPGGTLMGCGAIGALAPYCLYFQIDFHGPGADTRPADDAQTISALFRDEWLATQLQAANQAVAPLHADEPRQIPFMNGEDQYEDRWVLEVALQVNAVVTIPQEFADAAVVGLIDVDAVYPPH